MIYEYHDCADFLLTKNNGIFFAILSWLHIWSPMVFIPYLFLEEKLKKETHAVQYINSYIIQLEHSHGLIVRNAGLWLKGLVI